MASLYSYMKFITKGMYNESRAQTERNFLCIYVYVYISSTIYEEFPNKSAKDFRKNSGYFISLFFLSFYLQQLLVLSNTTYLVF